MPSNEDTAQPEKKRTNKAEGGGKRRRKEEAAEKLYSDLNLATFV